MKLRDSGKLEEEYWESLFNVPLILDALQIGGPPAGVLRSRTRMAAQQSWLPDRGSVCRRVCYFRSGPPNLPVLLTASLFVVWRAARPVVVRSCIRECQFCGPRPGLTCKENMPLFLTCPRQKKRRKALILK